MIVKPFFPGPVFGWIFFGVLMVLLGIAAVIDLRRALVPKWISMTVLALGVLGNMVRGAWMGEVGRETWKLGSQGLWMGLADGLLFALAGFLVGFGLFFLMFALGICRGGDVKLFTALSAWVGPSFAIWIFILSTFILMVLLLLIGRFPFIPHSLNVPQALPPDKKSKVPVQPESRPGRGMTFSFPMALGTAVVLLWFFRFDLKLVEQPHPAALPAQAAPASFP